MKGFTLSLIAVIGLLFINTSAQAALNYETAYMVTGDNSHTLSLNTFGEYQYDAPSTPWVYIKFKLSDLDLNSPLHLQWVWSNKNNPNQTETELEKLSLSGLTGDKEIWRQVPDSWWTSYKTQSTWQVDANWFNVHGTDGISMANFDYCQQGGPVINAFRQSICTSSVPVAPEPVSTTLFILGGAPVAASIMRKKFKKA